MHEKGATQPQALLFSSEGIASPRHTDTVLLVYSHVSASQPFSILTESEALRSSEAVFGGVR